MLNEPLAKHYGIDGVYGRAFRPVALAPDKHRGGLLSHASILLINSTGGDSHPIRRAVWIRDRLLNDPPAPPPPNVPSLEEPSSNFNQLSIRAQLEQHRTKEACKHCHRNLDGWGLALENFDAIGRWRTEVQKKGGDNSAADTIDAVSELPGGVKIDGADGLKSYLVGERKDAFARSLVSRGLTYAIGRSLELGDQRVVDEVLKEFAADEYRLQGLIQKIIMSDPFQMK